MGGATGGVVPRRRPIVIPANGGPKVPVSGR
jgi:hypothetical protein